MSYLVASQVSGMFLSPSGIRSLPEMIRDVITNPYASEKKTASLGGPSTAGNPQGILCLNTPENYGSQMYPLTTEEKRLYL